MLRHHIIQSVSWCVWKVVAKKFLCVEYLGTVEHLGTVENPTLAPKVHTLRDVSNTKKTAATGH